LNAYRLLSKLPKYVKQFGLLSGLRLLLQVERDVPQLHRTKQYRLPGYSRPIHLRDTISDHSTFWQCLVMCQYDFSRFPQSKRLMTEYRVMVNKGIRPLIIDCGGNIGLATVWFAMHFPEARVCVLEPDTKNFEILRQNVGHFGDQVIALQGGVWSDPGVLRIVNPASGSAAFRVGASAEATEHSIRAYTIAEVCKLAGADSPFIVKIDIEGAQGQLFSKNTTWVPQTRLIMLELDDWQMPWQGTSRSFFSCVSQYEFDYLLDGELILCFRDSGQMT
jgi:FkbM family methyltransferase